MNGLFVSQVMSLDASQLDVDKAEKAREQAETAQLANEEVFMKVLNESMKEVNDLVQTEQMDSRLEEKEKDEKEQDQEEDQED